MYTYGFMLKISLKADTFESLFLCFSATNFSLVQVICTFSGTAAATLALTAGAECEAVFLSWISWAWPQKNHPKIQPKRAFVEYTLSKFWKGISKQRNKRRYRKMHLTLWTNTRLMTSAWNETACKKCSHWVYLQD